MKKNEELKLQQLNVRSFHTQLNEEESATIQGGTTPTFFTSYLVPSWMLVSCTPDDEPDYAPVCTAQNADSCAPIVSEDCPSHGLMCDIAFSNFWIC